MNFSAFNLNSLQTILTGFIVVAIALLKFTGCTELATGAVDCTNSWLAQYVGAGTLVWIIGIIGFIKLTVIPWLQPGGWLANLFAPKAPVTAQHATGTVTPAQVAK